MAKTINDIIEDFDVKLNNSVEKAEEEVTKSTEEEEVTTEEVTEEPTTEEPAEEVTEEPAEEAEEVTEEVAEEVAEEPTTEEPKEEEQEVPAEEETVEKSNKEDEEEEEDEKDKKDKKDKAKDEDEDEDEEDVKKSEEETLVKSADLLGAIEMVFKNLHDVIKTNAELNEKLDKLSQEFAEAKEVKETQEELAKSANVTAEVKTGIEDVAGKAVGYVNKSVDVEEEVANVEDTTEVIVDGETVVEPEQTFYEKVQEIRPNFLETYKRVSQSGTASRGEVEEARHLWGGAKTVEDLDKVQAFIDKFK